MFSCHEMRWTRGAMWQLWLNAVPLPRSRWNNSRSRGISFTSTAIARVPYQSIPICHISFKTMNLRARRFRTLLYCIFCLIFYYRVNWLEFVSRISVYRVNNSSWRDPFLYIYISYFVNINLFFIHIYEYCFIYLYPWVCLLLRMYIQLSIYYRKIDIIK